MSVLHVVRGTKSKTAYFHKGTPVDQIPPYNFVEVAHKTRFDRPDLLDKNWALGKPFKDYHPGIADDWGHIRYSIWCLVPLDWGDPETNELGEVAP